MRCKMITISSIKTILEPIVDVYEDHITEKTQVQLPYVVLIEMSSQNMFADNSTYQQVMPLQAILHQAKRNQALEEEIKAAFTDNHIPFEQDTEWDKDNLLYATTFDING